ncbi:hypothetical protein ACRAKI_22320 [Saccharothrix isguenensis]
MLVGLAGQVVGVVLAIGLMVGKFGLPYFLRTVTVKRITVVHAVRVEFRFSGSNGPTTDRGAMSELERNRCFADS